MSLAGLADRVAARLGPGTSRRDFLSRTAVASTAVAVAPRTFLLRPVTAYAAVCPTPSSCPPGSRCAPSGYTEFCCTTSGRNACPPGTLVAGWWRADGSGFCGPGAPRYYLDCNAGCGSCGCGASGVCSGECSGTACTCGACSCGNWKAGCTRFRYGQCNQSVACVGPIVCRIVTCVPPWVLEPTCTTTLAVDNNTRFHDAPCLHPPTEPTDGDLWLTAADGAVYAYGAAGYHGGANTFPRNRPIVGMAATPSGRGYWQVASDGGVFCFGDAQFHGSTGAIRLNRPIVAMAPTASGGGYWLVASDGGVFAFGDAPFHGSAVGSGVQAPFVGMARAGGGYWLAAANGRVLAFGPTAVPSQPPPALTSSITTITPTRTGNGYYLVGGDGSVHPAGDAGNRPGGPQPVHHSVVGAASAR